MTRASRRLLLWAPVALLVAYQFYLSSLSDLPTPDLPISDLDKLAHAGYFFLIAALAYRAGRWGEGWGRRTAAVVALLVAFLYGSIDEWHQRFTPLRDFDPLDLLADTAGAFLAALVSERIWERFERRSG